MVKNNNYETRERYLWLCGLASPLAIIMLILFDHFIPRRFIFQYLTFFHWSVFYFVLVFLASFIYSKKIFSVYDAEGDSNKPNKYYVTNLRWMNFLISIVGWGSLYYFLFYRLLSNPSPMQWRDYIFIIVFLFGVTGYFPSLIDRFLQSKNI